MSQPDDGSSRAAPQRVINVARSLPQQQHPTPEPQPAETLYDRVGGEAFFHRLVDEFYAQVADDDVLRPLYPDEDLGPANERLRLFLIQYWGGPSTYSQRRGHPRLRMRHAPFPVGSEQIEAWLAAMRTAVDTVCEEADVDHAVEEELWAYFERAAHFMRNQPE